MNSYQIKTAAEHLQYGADLKFQEVRESRGRASKARASAELTDRQAAFLEEEANALLAAANHIEGRGR